MNTRHTKRRIYHGSEDRIRAVVQRAHAAAFSLVELLVVMAIIGILVGLTLPALQGLAEPKSVDAAARQLADDLGYARLRAINERTTVYMVFVPPTFFGRTWDDISWRRDQQKIVNNLYSFQYRGYALLTLRSVGEQPGVKNPKYLTDWKSLPQGVLIDTNKFRVIDERTWQLTAEPMNRPFRFRQLPFPKVESRPLVDLPYIAFDSRGRLESGRDTVIALYKGSIMCAETNGMYRLDIPADVQIKGTGADTNTLTLVRTDWLTGRTQIEKPEIK